MGRGRTARARTQYEYLLPIQTQGARPPIFGVHVLGQNAIFYRPLSEHLGPDQPVWGLGLAGNFADTTAPTDVSAITKLYADELERCAPTGPVALAAVSIGSVVAVELARLLIARGRDVALLALFDAAGPDADQFAPSKNERVRMHLAEFRRHPIPYVRHLATRRREVLAWKLEQLETTARTRLGLKLPDRLRIRRFVDGNIQAASGLDMEPYPGRITVFKAGDDVFSAPLVRARHGLGAHRARRDRCRDRSGWASLDAPGTVRRAAVRRARRRARSGPPSQRLMRQHESSHAIPPLRRRADREGRGVTSARRVPRSSRASGSPAG